MPAGAIEARRPRRGREGQHRLSMPAGAIEATETSPGVYVMHHFQCLLVRLRRHSHILQRLLMDALNACWCD